MNEHTSSRVGIEPSNRALSTRVIVNGERIRMCRRRGRVPRLLGPSRSFIHGRQGMAQRSLCIDDHPFVACIKVLRPVLYHHGNVSIIGMVKRRAGKHTSNRWAGLQYGVLCVHNEHTYAH